jgi:hypothetical protein
VEKDREKIREIISKILDKSKEDGWFGTIIANIVCDELEAYVDEVRFQAIGWTFADDCVDTDNDMDIRKKDPAIMIERAKIDLGK